MVVRRIWLRILLIFRQRRSERLLTQALRKVPKPVPPEGLRDRLLDQAAASITASAPPERRRRWIAAAAVAVLAAAVVSLGWWSSVHRNETARLSEAPRKPSDRRTMKNPPKPRIVEKPKEQPGSETPQRRPQVPESKPKVAYRNARPKLKRANRPVESHVVEAPSQDTGSSGSTMPDSPEIVVTVSRTPRDSEGYARAAAYDTNTAGEAVKTEWTITDDPRSRVSSQELAVTDASGQQSQVTVACSNRKVQKNGEEL